VKSTLTTASPTTETSFRLFLQSELARRCARNAQYSLRAFAMHVGVDHSTLSQWLRGRRAITARSIETTGATLGLQPDAIQRYIEHAGRDDGPAAAADILTGDTFSIIADWYHFAILELTRLDEFRCDSRWIARVLDVSVDEVNLAVQRMIRLGLLDMESADRWIDRSGDGRVSLESVPAEALNRQQDQSRRLSLAAVRTAPVTLRDHSSMTLAVNSTRLPRAVELITRCREQLVELLQEGAADDVYQIEIAIFPVTTMWRDRFSNRPIQGGSDVLSRDAVADPGERS
jgi:transcriptional regulator with XRE-family HTH domain